MFYGMNPEQTRRFGEALRAMKEIQPRIFAADMVIALARNMGFLRDAAFMQAMNAEPRSRQEKSLVWRLHVLCWAAESALAVEGDFVECGVFKGLSTSVVAHYLDFGKRDRTWYLYDTFAGIPAEQLDAGRSNPKEYQDAGLYPSVVRRFAAYSNIRVNQGRVPEVLAQSSPQRIAFMHIDMNSAAAEVAALEVLFDRMTPGGLLVLDDYGWYWYRDQKKAEDPFFLKRGLKVLELPTGQGLVLKR